MEYTPSLQSQASDRPSLTQDENALKLARQNIDRMLEREALKPTQILTQQMCSPNSPTEETHQNDSAQLVSNRTDQKPKFIVKNEDAVPQKLISLKSLIENSQPQQSSLVQQLQSKIQQQQ